MIETWVKRYWSYVDVRGADECWPWLASANGRGYGQLSMGDGEVQAAHRLAWFLASGPIPKGKHVCHHCDNKICCNPVHLFLGTALDNMRDKMSKGRGNHAHGEALPHTKLNSQQVRQIRNLHATGRRSYRQLGKQFDVTSGTIGHIITRLTWAWLDAH